MSLAILAIIGLVLGRLVRKVTPYLVGWQDTSLPFKLPWVELLAGAAFLLVDLERGHDPDQWKWLLFALLLLAVTATDHLCKYIPGKLCYAGAGLGLVLAGLVPQDILALLGQESLLGFFGLPLYRIHMGGLALSALGSAMGFLVMEFIRRIFRPIVKMDVMGMGDSLLMMMAGAFVGPRVILYALLPGCLIGVVMGFVWKLILKTPHFPFGPSLSLGAFLMLLYGTEIINSINGFHQLLYNLPPTVLLLFSLFLVALLVVLLLRLKKKAAVYERMIEEDYRKIDEKMES